MKILGMKQHVCTSAPWAAAVVVVSCFSVQPWPLAALASAASAPPSRKTRSWLRSDGTSHLKCPWERNEMHELCPSRLACAFLHVGRLRHLDCLHSWYPTISTHIHWYQVAHVSFLPSVCSQGHGKSQALATGNQLRRGQRPLGPNPFHHRKGVVRDWSSDPTIEPSKHTHPCLVKLCTSPMICIPIIMNPLLHSNYAFTVSFREIGWLWNH